MLSLTTFHFGQVPLQPIPTCNDVKMQYQGAQCCAESGIDTSTTSVSSLTSSWPTTYERLLDLEPVDQDADSRYFFRTELNSAGTFHKKMRDYRRKNQEAFSLLAFTNFSIRLNSLRSSLLALS